MYNKQRTNWWKERSLSTEHQKAYDNIASYLNFGWKIFLDVACGSGELLKRVKSNYENRFCIGTDATEEMLEAARYNIGRSKTKIVNSLEKAFLSVGKVNLFLDDISNSSIPENFADVSMISFPEVISRDNKICENEKELFKKLIKVYETQDAYKLSRQLNVERNVVKKTKLGGKIIIVEYDVKPADPYGESHIFTQHVKSAELIGAKFDNLNFFDSPKVWKDTKGEPRQGERQGYRVFELIRER